MNKLRVFLADDHAIVREGLRALINAQPDLEVVGEAGDGWAVLALVPRLRPDVVVMDISMPQLTGAQATEKLHVACPGVKILGLTVHASRAYWQQLIKAGASGYVLKRSPGATLIEALHIVAKGGTFLDPGLSSQLTSSLVQKTAEIEILKARELSERETEVLQHIARGLSTKEIAAELGVSTKTVEKHKARSLSKLGLNSRAEVVQYALTCGWLEQV